MAIEKTLQKIKIQIGELSETLQLFAEDTIHPSAEDCDKLRKQLNSLLEDLAVYKYCKNNKEISPSYNLHAKVSEKASELGNVAQITHSETAFVETGSAQKVTSEQTKETIKAKPVLSIGINDKFRFINELFLQNSSEYNIVLEQLNNLQNWNDTEVYLNSLKSVYGWKESHEVVRYFYSVARKRFD